MATNKPNDLTKLAEALNACVNSKFAAHPHFQVDRTEQFKSILSQHIDQDK